MNKNDFLKFNELSQNDLKEVFAMTTKMKKEQKEGKANRSLSGKSVVMIFEKPSTRTRISFEVGISQLGALAVTLNRTDMQLDRGETIEDTARVISRYVDAIVIRAFYHKQIEILASAASIPVVNALSDMYHPCQALSDLFTIKEKMGGLKGLKMTYLGDGNNVCHSLMLAVAVAGMVMNIACPEGFSPEKTVYKDAKKIADKTGASINIMRDPKEAANNANILYTDVWVSMGDEKNKKERHKSLEPYQLDQRLLSLADKDALVMHCLPAHRGEEITGNVIDGPHSVILDQAENRLHTQKALIEYLMLKRTA